MAITDQDIQKLKTIFATKEDLRNALIPYATKDDSKALENRVVEFLDHIVKQNESMLQELTATNRALRRHEDKLENHEGRIKVLEAKAV